MSKKETLEEASENYVRNESDVTIKLISKYSFKDGAKWQQERMYSEEEVYNLLCKMPNYFKMTIPQQTQARKEWFDQFKKS